MKSMLQCIQSYTVYQHMGHFALTMTFTVKATLCFALVKFNEHETFQEYQLTLGR